MLFVGAENCNYLSRGNSWYE